MRTEQDPVLERPAAGQACLCSTAGGLGPGAADTAEQAHASATR